MPGVTVFPAGYEPLVVSAEPRALVRRLRDIVAWDEPWDYEDDDADTEAIPAS